MRIAGIPLALAALTCAGQAPMAPASSTAQSLRPDHAIVAQLEGGFETRIKSLDANEPFVLLGATSGIYLSGIGLVFTTPMDLITTPQISPFHTVISPAEKVGVHQRKLGHLPLLQKALKETVMAAAGKLPNLAPGEKIVFAARLYYFDWEDKTGLPSQIVASADRESALAGKVQMEEQ